MSNKNFALGLAVSCLILNIATANEAKPTGNELEKLRIRHHECIPVGNYGGEVFKALYKGASEDAILDSVRQSSNNDLWKRFYVDYISMAGIGQQVYSAVEMGFNALEFNNKIRSYENLFYIGCLTDARLDPMFK